nr:HD domain-containing protein [Lachnospiraceae bacterium]
IGTKIARPVYNKDGVLWYNIGVKVDETMIERMKKLNMYGIYVLDPAEPPPPITDAELDFDRFQSVQTYTVDEILTSIVKGKQPDHKKFEDLMDLIYHRYGFMDKEMTFNQCLRTENDFISKHSLNVCILTAILAGKMKLDNREKKYLLEAALFHDIGKLLAPKEILNKQEKLTEVELERMHQAIMNGFNMMTGNYAYPSGVRRYLLQLSRDLSNRLPNYAHYDQELLPGTKIIMVADIYDTLTAIRPYKAPVSAYSALKIIRNEPGKYDEHTVDALTECIAILPAGSYVLLSNGEQAIVVRENRQRITRPVVLGLASNTLYDLSLKAVHNEIQIVDSIMTPDNRQRVSQEAVEKFVAQAKNS